LKLRVAIQRDPVEGSKPGETSHYLARDAEARGHEVWVYTPGTLAWDDGRVVAEARRIHYGDGWRCGPSTCIDLAEADVVLIRQDPPVDMAWLTTTWLLDLLPRRTLVLNPPGAIRDTPEKLVPLQVPDLVPPTLVTADRERIRRFRDEHGDVVLKPLFDKSGAGLFFLDRDDPNFDVVVEGVVAPVAVQRYQPEAREGSVRVLVVAGRVVSALRGVPGPRSRRGNLDRSARVEACALTDVQAALVARVSALLARRGILLAGIDLVGPWLLEVNVTSPGGFVWHDRLGGEPIAPAFWSAVERSVRPAGDPVVPPSDPGSPLRIPPELATP
jgi:glutathione synthase